jgi:cytochrome b6-f complex iron-sulfur subunit
MVEERDTVGTEERRARHVEEVKQRVAAKLEKDDGEQESPSLPEKRSKAKAQPAKRPEIPTMHRRQNARGQSQGAMQEPTEEQPQSAAASPVPAKAEDAGQAGVNRREFMSYAWGAALGLLTLEGGAATYFFMYPRFRAGEFGGKFHLGPANTLPPQGTLPPDLNAAGKYWLSHTDTGIKALYQVCTHLGCLYKWSETNQRFECPCHGSKFTAAGDYIEGPAPRSLDQFVVEVVETGTVTSETEDTGESIVPPVVPSADAQIVVDTGRRVLGKQASTSPARDDG